MQTVSPGVDSGIGAIRQASETCVGRIDRGRVPHSPPWARLVNLIFGTFMTAFPSLEPLPSAAMRPSGSAAALPLLQYPEHEERAALLLSGERLAGLVDEMRHVDDGQRIRALEHERSADRDLAQGFSCPQHRLRAAQTAQVEDRVVHGRVPGITGGLANDTPALRIARQAAVSSFVRIVYLNESGSR